VSAIRTSISGARALRASALRAVRDERLTLGALLVLAAAVRLPGLATRGGFDADQGHDALTLLRFTRDGVFPLLGPPTSIGDFHHGAFYYLLLAPAAAVSGSDPVALQVAIALMGVAAVGVTWWLARAMAGPVAGPIAGAIAGLLLALSPAGISESTFIWNPNPIPLFASLALASAWQGHRMGRARWWVLAIACAGVVFQLHILGIVFIPPVLALLVVDVGAARRRGDGSLARRLAGAAVAGLAVVALLFVPLLVHELQFNWSETRNAIAYFTSGSSSPGELGLPARLLFTLLRIVGWPLVGLVTDAPAAAALALAVVLTLGIWGALGAREPEPRFALRWLLLTVAWATVALAVLAPSLQTVVAGLPNDHYHAFVDPIVVAIVGIAGGLLATGRLPLARRGRPEPPMAVARGTVAVVVLALAAIGISRWPTWTDPNGGWPAAEAAGERVVSVVGSAPVAVLDVPDFKSADGIAFPIVHAGGHLLPDNATQAPYWVVVCDRLFESVVGQPCGGPAEDRRVADALGASLAQAPAVVDRFDLSPRTSVSVYKP